MDECVYCHRVFFGVLDHSVVVAAPGDLSCRLLANSRTWVTLPGLIRRVFADLRKWNERPSEAAAGERAELLGVQLKPRVKPRALYTICGRE
jgi:hypothetical protein